ncbi:MULTISPECIES: hypothetical protein [Streptomyces]|uniref:hypothetical protein n=1 Tax=Streptomyces TaxID=1883 RepID=UPI00039F97F9|nr:MULTISPECIES: hypothetical protein [Streptomyces]MBZ6109955.1 hypothetical protein [Streptomyces olivaceus]MBZ6124238.1 hypothetical protein [Streptomyces olivaceus]MBZ6144346.1 hypothetical protein [Streptomyces olivaceus]MBZ6161780.1 hypothetical protein [Streptomyces olivaceus]MBZ6185982.1 hypothetical protein [Streptomyces olivaceus]
MQPASRGTDTPTSAPGTPQKLEIDHAVVGGGSGFVETTADFTQPAAECNVSRWSDKVNTDAVAAASVAGTGLGLGTLKFSGPGAVAEAEGIARP